MGSHTERKGHPLEGVGPGTTLDGRYTTQRRIEQRRGAERWTAEDTTLGRSVILLCLPDDDSRRSALLDSARRAAGVETPTLHRVLDVGRENGVAWVVEADSTAARSLAELVEEGGLPADEVRRIVGEVATALESARQRGLHHLDLRPEDVLRTVDGEVRLRGVATSAALAELDDLESEDASRRDAVGVVSLAYAGLTGLWPGPDETSLGSAPRVLGGVAAPSEIAAGVPRDLDALCRLTLGEDQGPTSPGDFARQIAPWPSRQVAGRSTLVTSSTVDPRRSAAVPPVEVAPAQAPPTPSPTTPPLTPAALAAAERQGHDGGDGELVEGDEPSEDDTPTHVMERPTGQPEAAASPDSTQTQVLPVSAGSTPSPAGPAAPGPTKPSAASGPGAGAGAAAAASAAGAAVAGAGSAVAGAVGRLGSRVGTLGRQVGDRAAEKAAERRGFHDRITGPNAPGLTPDGERLRPGTGRDAVLEAPAPLVPAQPLTKDESKTALAIVAGFLILALIIGLWGVSRIGSKTRDLDFGGLPGSSASNNPSSSSSSSPSASGSQEASPSATTGESMQVLAADGYDPEGDGRENGTLAPRVFDGDPKTSWQSEGYASAAFGGLKKGVGVSVDLGPNVAARTVKLTLNNTADVSVYIGAEKSLKDATKVGEKDGANGTVTFPVKAGTQGQYVIVWFTQLTPDDKGRYRAILGEVEVTN
ncbi:protein kinase family protein [Knoellia sp. Soil729]|uniref:protein kinase family protein n=1 Tax=Knoellia sp. Soil729 TaxID=1736394 RepID=UPI0007007338|nr:protein kinase family protein [Knoellia sp. Soil729]KRE42863.1 hypothetical protein ASG74_10915 [Knoellia sp. Soil729]